MKTAFEDFKETAIYENLLWAHEEDPNNKKNFLLSLKTAFLIGRALGLEEASSTLKGT